MSTRTMCVYLSHVNTTTHKILIIMKTTFKLNNRLFEDLNLAVAIQAISNASANTEEKIVETAVSENYLSLEHDQAGVYIDGETDEAGKRVYINIDWSFDFEGCPVLHEIKFGDTPLSQMRFTKEMKLEVETECESWVSRQEDSSSFCHETAHRERLAFA